jgi:transposase
METITVTPAEIIYRRRIAVLEHAARTKNVAATCRTFGISRTRYYQWKKRADAYGLDALMPKARRAPQMPEATPTHVVERLLTLAVLEPTIGCRQYADRLGDQGFSIAKSTVQPLGLWTASTPGASRIGCSSSTSTPARWYRSTSGTRSFSGSATRTASSRSISVGS